MDNYLFKSFIFEGKNENRLIKSVKEWAYDAYKLQDKYNIIFITDIEESSGEYTKVMKILKEESKDVISSDDIFDYILSKTSGQTSLY